MTNDWFAPTIKESFNMQAIQKDEYQVNYDPASATAVWSGNFRLHGPDYLPILTLMREAADNGQGSFTLDLRELKFLNSAGINTLYKFVIQMGEQQGSQVVIKGNARHPWQKKALNNLLLLMPDVQLELA
jgi:hypothetical protein